MPSMVGAVVTGAVALSLVASVPAAQSQGPATPPAISTTTPAETPRFDQFEGTWKYVADESVNAYTGRPEHAPTRTGTNARSGGGGSGGGGSRPPSQPGGPGIGGNPGGGNPGGYPGPAGTGSGGQNPPTVGGAVPGLMGGIPTTNAPPGIDPSMFRGGWAAAWARSAQRDLLEVPWSLTIDVTPEAVTFVDDLERSRTYLTDAKRKKFQLGAAVFHAKTYWEGARLRKDIDAVGQFKMTETYFLSEDASRLFVIIRLGDPKQAASKNAPLAGVNRVYDRAER
jgi:hypothetical protein